MTTRGETTWTFASRPRKTRSATKCARSSRPICRTASARRPPRASATSRTTSSPGSASSTRRAGRCRTGRRNGAAPAGAPVQLYIFKEEMQQAPAPEPLPFGVTMVGPVIIAFGREDAEEAIPAAHRQSRRLVVPGLLRAGRGLRPRLAQDHAPSATATTTSSTARRPGRRSAQYADWIFCLARTDPSGQEAGRHHVPADRHEDAGHHGAADPDHRRRPRGQRGVLRRRAGAGREPASARRTRAGTTPSSCSATSASASRASASRRRRSAA